MRAVDVTTSAQDRLSGGFLRVLAVGVAGMILGIIVLARMMATAGGEVTIATAFGEENRAITEHAEEVLGRDVYERASVGHDGRFFFLQSLDPLFLTPSEHASLLDRPVYRSQRMLYPLLAGGVGLFPATWIPWTMVIVNVLALGIGSAGTARYAIRLGANPAWGLAFALNPGVVSEFALSGAGVLAFAAAVWGFVATDQRRWTEAAALFSLSALSREVMLVAAAGALYLIWRSTGSWRWRIVVAPAAAVAVWAGYVRVRLESGSGLDEVREIGLPLVGLGRALERWLSEPIDLVIGLVTIWVLVLFTMRVIRSNDVFGWGTVGFVAIASVLTEQVWLQYSDITRAVAPALTGFVIVSFAARVPAPPGDG